MQRSVISLVLYRGVESGLRWIEQKSHSSAEAKGSDGALLYFSQVSNKLGLCVCIYGLHVMNFHTSDLPGDSTIAPYCGE